MNTHLACLACVVGLALPLAAAPAQRAETPYWQITYRGAGQLVLQPNVVPVIDLAVDPVSSNITHFEYETEPSTNMPMYGLTDNLPFIIWVLNGDARGSLKIKPNTRSRRVATQRFSIICSNSSMKRIVIKIKRNSLFGDALPLGAHAWNPIAKGDRNSGWIFADGDVGKLILNCSLWGTVVGARTFGLVKFAHAYASAIIAGEPGHVVPEIFTSGKTNRNVVVFSNGEITRLLGGRLLSTVVLAGGPMLEIYMDQAQAALARPELRPTGRIGRLKALEIGALGDDHGDRWILDLRELPGPCGAVVAGETDKLRVKRVCTEGTSVYITR
jgi:hypothetical protein